MDDREKEATRQRYVDRLVRYGYDPRTLGWNKGRQALRFEILLSGWPESVSSVLDVGCGFGDLGAYCARSGRHGWRYTGIDIVGDLIEEGRRQHAGLDLRMLDMDSEPLPQDHDLIVASGLFSFRISDNLSFVARSFERFHAACRVGFAANFMSTSAELRYDNLFYADPGELLALARRFSNRVVLRHDYMPFEFTLLVFRDDGFAAETAVFRDYERLVDRQKGSQ